MLDELLDREGLSDKEYVKKLEDFLKELFDEKKTKIIGYLGLTNFIETNSKLLNDLELAPNMEDAPKLLDMDADDIERLSKNVADFNDKKIQPMLKFSEKMYSMMQDCDKMRAELKEIGIDKPEKEVEYQGNSKLGPEGMADKF